jgi:hypothetical protein
MEKKINKLCEKCIKKCKQSDMILLLKCPDFDEKPKQLEINFKTKFKKRKNKC